MKKLNSQISFSPWFISCFIFVIACVNNGCEKGENNISPDVEEYLPSDVQACWSHDGKWIVFRRENYAKIDSTKQTGLYIADSTGKNIISLLAGDYFYPNWSPLGDKIIFTDGGSVYEINIDGSGFKKIISPGRFPRFTHSGKKIIYGKSGDQSTVGLYLYDVLDSTYYRLGYGSQPDFSPDDSQLVICGSISPTSGSQISIVQLSDFSNTKIVTNNRMDNVEPKWSPNGSLISWISYASKVSEIWIMNSDGTNQRKLVYGTHINWHPNSPKIIISDYNYDKSKVVLYEITINNSQIKQITY